MKTLLFLGLFLSFIGFAAEELTLDNVVMYHDYEYEPGDLLYDGYFPAPVTIFYGALLRNDVRVTVSENCKGHIQRVGKLDESGKGLLLTCDPFGDSSQRFVFAQSVSSAGYEGDRAVQSIFFKYNPSVSLNKTGRNTYQLVIPN